jgi:small-conductance mechanosensitive channel
VSHDTAAKPDAVVRLGETTAFTLRVAGGGRSAAERARLATKALASAVDDPRATEIKVVLQGDVAVVYAGSAPIIQLFEDDARAARDSSLEVHASAVAASVRQAIAAERQRSRVAKNVFSLSLVVFFALIAFYLMRKLGEVAERIQSWLEENGDRVLAIRVQRIELVTPAVLKSSALIALSLAKWIGQFGIFYSWLVVVLSLFEATRGYTERLTGFVVSPLSQLMGRLATALPLLVVAVIAALSVFVLVRFVGLFFAGVARRETALAWLPPDLAGPTSVLLRLAIVLAALVFAAPVVTGDSDGALGRAGAIALVAIGLAATPLLATGLVGTVVLFGRRLRVGEHVEFSGLWGRISGINLLELRLETSERTELRIPHLLLLKSPLRGVGLRPRLGVEIAVSAETAPATVRRVLDEGAARVGRDVRTDVLSADADGIVYRVTAICDSLESRSALTTSLVEALSAAAIPLGRASGRARPV